LTAISLDRTSPVPKGLRAVMEPMELRAFKERRGPKARLEWPAATVRMERTATARFSPGAEIR
jgi:hypothetical protein